MNHQCETGEIGGYTWQPNGGKAGRIVCDNPYPCAFDQGLLETIAQRFEPSAKVTHEEGACRHEGGDACTFKVEW